jgi:hypothetical protein
MEYRVTNGKGMNITEDMMSNPGQLLVKESGGNIYYSYKLKGGFKDFGQLQARLIRDKIREGGSSVVETDNESNEIKQQVEVWYYKNENQMKKIRDVEIISTELRNT